MWKASRFLAQLQALRRLSQDHCTSTMNIYRRTLQWWGKHGLGFRYPSEPMVEWTNARGQRVTKPLRLIHGPALQLLMNDPTKKAVIKVDED